MDLEPAAGDLLQHLPRGVGAGRGPAQFRDGAVGQAEPQQGVFEVGRQLGMRHTPTLEFVLDAVPDNARHIEDLLEQAKESDASVARRAAEADYAGEADPYRRRDEDEAEPS